MQTTNLSGAVEMMDLTADEAREVIGGLMSPIGDVLSFVGSDEYFTRTQVGAIA